MATTKTQSKGTASKNNSQDQKQRKTLKQWRGEIKQANDVGFSHGYYAVEDLPKAMGANRAAKAGFSEGVDARKKAEQAAARARKYKK